MINNLKSQLRREGETAYCKMHPTAYLGKDQWGNWYSICWQGKKIENLRGIVNCKIIIEKKEVNYENI